MCPANRDGSLSCDMSAKKKLFIFINSFIWALFSVPWKWASLVRWDLSNHLKNLTYTVPLSHCCEIALTSETASLTGLCDKPETLFTTIKLNQVLKSYDCFCEWCFSILTLIFQCNEFYSSTVMSNRTPLMDAPTHLRTAVDDGGILDKKATILYVVKTSWPYINF